MQIRRFFLDTFTVQHTQYAVQLCIQQKAQAIVRPPSGCQARGRGGSGEARVRGAASAGAQASVEAFMR